MPVKERRPRIIFEIDRDLKARFDANVNDGLRSKVLHKLVEMSVEAIERHGWAILGAVLSGVVRFEIKEAALVALEESRSKNLTPTEDADAAE